MTNEELAIAYKSAAERDKPELAAKLWEQNKALLAKMAHSFFTLRSGACIRSGQTLEDLQQIAYFAMLGAVEAFDTSTGYKLSTYLSLQAKKMFNEAVGRWKKDKAGEWKSIADPLNTCTSLDKPVYDEKDGGEIGTLGDALEDSKQTDMIERAEDSIYKKDLHKALEKSICTLAEDQQNVIRLRYYKNLTQEQCGHLIGMTRTGVCCIEAKAMRGLRHPSRLVFLNKFHNDTINRFAWCGNGLSSWRECGASGVERAVERANKE